MNENSSTMNYESNNQSPSPDHFSKIAFKKIGIIEVLVGTVIFLLIFGILNYFNILPLSDMFPKYLSFLPRQSSQQDKTSQSSSQTPTSPPNYSPSAFKYDKDKAIQGLTAYMRNVIEEEFLPNIIDIKQGLSTGRSQTNLEHEFGIKIISKGITISASFHYKKNSNIANDFEIFIQPNNISKTTVTPKLASDLVLTYFNNPTPITGCQTKDATSYCESFAVMEAGKRGYGIAFLNQGTFTPFVFTCFLPKEGDNYANYTSCISPN